MFTVDELKEKGLVIRNGTQYYLANGEGIAIGNPLGQSKADANKKIQEMVESGELTSLIDLSSQPSGEGSNASNPSKDDTLKTIPDVISIEDERAKSYADQLAFLEDLSDNFKAGADHVFIGGIDSRNSDHPTIMSAPAHVRWRAKNNMVDNGETFTNRGYLVLLKTMTAFRTGPYKITVNRDDTPKLPFYTIGENVLCVCGKKKFIERKETDRRAGVLINDEISDARNEKAKALASIKEVEDVKKVLSKDNTTSLDTMAGQMKERGFSQSEIDNKVNQFLNIGEDSKA